MIGTTIAHYRITASLGKGGMGEVWRAEDTRLGREVAIKVLPEEHLDHPDRIERFEREARAVAALNHPSIVTIHSVEEADGLRFLTMELIDGKTLDSLISVRGMDLNRFLDVASPIAEALASAHERGVIHRDLKPSNVMVTDEMRVKVLDFGLAKLMEPQDDTDEDDLPTEALTGFGVVMGTMPYMSPEQVEGQPVDHRTDIFSLGILMYEMATGDRPFAGKSSPGLMSAILKDDPVSVVEKRRDLPNHLGRIIGRCLEKEPRDRYQTARDVFNELRTVRRESGSLSARPPQPQDSSEPSRLSPDTAASDVTRRDEGFWVAVLPFKIAGDDADLAALADGLSEDIVTGLSRFPYLRVVARGSATTDARYLMEGSLRRSGTKLRVAVQLVDTESGAHLWAEAYDRDFAPDNLFALQDDLVPRIVSTVADMNGVLPRSMSDALRSSDPARLSPYEAVLRSFGYPARATAEELVAALPGLESATREAPDDPNTWAMLSYLQIQDYAQGFCQITDGLSAGLAAARRAVEAGPDNPLAYLSLAQALFHHKEHAEFRNAAERAAALNPMDGNSMAFLGEMLVYAGERERGLELTDRAKRLNPNHPGWYWYVDFYDAYRQSDDRKALAFTRKVNLPGHWFAHASLAAAAGQLGEKETAEKAVQTLLEIRPEVAATVRTDIEKWWDPKYVDRLIDGLRKAGLEIGDVQEPVDASAVQHASSEQRADEGFWIAVLPFRYTGRDDDLDALADGLSEEIVTGLSRFPYLRVISRGSALRYAREDVDVRAVGVELGARYVMEGSLRRAGTKLRLAVQLVDTTTGGHLWAETYDRDFSPEALFDLQDDLVPRIVSTCADHFGVLAREISEAVRGKPIAEMTPYEALMRGFGYHFRLTAEEHAQARDALERAVEHAPSNADCWAMLAWVYSHEFSQDFNPRPNSLDRALEAARRATDIAPSNHFAQQVLAVVLFFRKETAECRSAAERSMALNPLDGSNEAFFLITFLGEWERGCALIRHAMELNPHHPGWYRAPLGVNEYRKENYRAAIDEAVKANAPNIVWFQLILAAAHGQLGELEAAGKALHNLLALKDDFAQSGRRLMGKWFEPELVEHLMVGLRKAGLEVAEHDEQVEPPATHHASGEQPVDEGFWVAVTPFKYGGTEPDLKALAEGLSEDIVTGLARFSYLRVIGRGSPTGDSRYVMEGTLRQAGKKLRVAVQLVDTESGAHLWAESYDRDFDPDELFALQDDLVPRIVSTCADHFGVLARAISEAVRDRPIDEMTPYEALMRGFGYHFRLSPDEHAEARDALERAVTRAPTNADCWAMLSWVYSHEVAHGFNPKPRSLDRALDAARKAVDLAPSNHLAQQVLAVTLFFRKETAACLSACERSFALNPLDGSNEAIFITCFSGDWEKGCALIRRSMELNPHHPAWYRLMFAIDEYRRGNSQAAVDEAVRSNAPDIFWTNWLLAAAYGQLGDQDAARKALDALLQQKPDFARSGRQFMESWFEPELVEHFTDGLRKAGLEFDGEALNPDP